MSFPYSMDAAEFTLYTYTPATVPCVPNVDSGPLSSYLPYIATDVANEVQMKMGLNRARTYAGNAIASKNWQNEYFAAAVANVIMILSVRLRRRLIQSIESGMVQAVQDAVGMITARIMYETPNLTGYFPPEVVNGAMEYLQMYNSIRQESDMPLQANQFQNRMMVQQPQQPLWSRFNNQGNQNTSGNQYANAISRGGNVTVGNQGGQSRALISDNDNSRFAGNVSAPSRNTAGDIYNKVSEAIVPPIEVLTEKDWKSSPTQYYKTLVDPRYYQKTYVRSNSKVIEVITPIEGTDMDRSRHTIGLLGQTFSLDGVVRKNELTTGVQFMGDVNKKTLGESIKNEGIVIPEMEMAGLCEYVYPHLLLDTFLDESIFYGRLKQAAYQGVNNGNVYRCFSIIWTPYITNYSYKKNLAILGTHKTFETLAASMKVSGTNLQKSQTDNPDRMNEIVDIIEYFSYVNIMLTERINSFLHYNLSLPNLTIGDFVSDIGQIIPYLKANYGDDYVSAFIKFERSHIENNVNQGIIPPLTDDQEQLLTDQLQISDDSKVNFAYVPTVYSFTYVNVLAKELNIIVPDKEALMIQQDVSPLLFELCVSLFDQNTVVPQKPNYDLLITKDNKIFKLYKGYLGKECYLIGK